MRNPSASPRSTRRLPAAIVRQLLLACPLLLAGGCGAPTDGQAPPFKGGAVPALTAVPIYQIQLDPAVNVRPGGQAGYGITSAVGNSFRLLWTGEPHSPERYTRFYGSVYTAGSFIWLTSACRNAECPLEAGDRVVPPVDTAGGQRVDFSAITSAGVDGFDFIVDKEPVFFELYIDDQLRPELVFFRDALSGGVPTRTDSMPFGILSK